MPSPLDPSGFQIAVQVKLPDEGTTWPLWMAGNALGGESTIFRGELEREFPDLPIVQAVEINFNQGLNGNLSVELYAPHELGMALLQSHLFTVGNVIEAQLGYPRIGRYMPWFATIAAKPDITLNEEGVSATLNGRGGAFASQRGSSPRTWTSRSRLQVIQDIAGRSYNNWSLDIAEALQGFSADSPLLVVRESISQGNMQDWVLIQHLCRQSECDAYVGPGRNEQGQTVVVIRPRVGDSHGRPRYTFVWRGQIDMINRFPIASFNSPSEGVWLPRGNATLPFNDVNPDTRGSTEGTVDQTTRDSSGLERTREASVGPGASPQEGVTVAALASSDDPSDPVEGMFVPGSARGPVTQEERANQIADEDGMRGGFKATIETIGLPDLFPGEMIRVENIGIFSGNYEIEGVAHRAGEGEWNMTLNLLARGIAAQEHIMSALRQSWQSFNDQESPETPDGAGGGDVSVLPEGSGT